MSVTWRMLTLVQPLHASRPIAQLCEWIYVATTPWR